MADEEHAKQLLAAMYTTGLNDFSGQWAFSVGLPARASVSGGILIVVPGVMSIAIYSPRLDGSASRLLASAHAGADRLARARRHQNSRRGVAFAKAFSQRCDHRRCN